MFNLDPGKLIVIAVVAIILLGPDKLPQFARQVGGAWRSFGEFRRRMEAEVRSTMPDLPPTSEIARLARSPAALLHHLSNLPDGDEEKAAADTATDAATAGEEPEATTPQALGENAVPAPATSAATAPLHADGAAHDATTNGSGPDGATPARAPTEPVVPADPNLN
jgi:sec-independent protein translocase protein TatB